MDEAIKLRGKLHLQLIKADGREEHVEIDNLVVSVGKNVVADRMQASPTKSAMSHVGVGTGATAPAVGDTTLSAEIAGSRAALATLVALAVITYTATLGPGIGTGAIAEAGLFNAPAAGDMLARTTFTAINKLAGDTLNVTWTVTVN